MPLFTPRRRATAVSLAVVASVTAAGTAGAQAKRQTKPLDPQNLDTTCAPCRDFYQFANGGWMARNPIPAAYSRWGSFNELADANTEAMRKVLDEAAAARKTAADPTERKLGDFYASCMDTVAIERQGAEPLATELAAIRAITTPAGVRAYLVRQHARGLNLVFGFGSTQDAKNSAEVIVGTSQGGLGLPDRDYYLNNDANSVKLRDAYVKHAANLIALTGESRAAADSAAGRILALETALANASFTRVQLRDPALTYNRKTPAELASVMPGFDWAGYFKAQKLGNVVGVNLQSPHFMTAVDSLLRAAPVDAWKAYFRYHVASAAAPSLSKPFVDEDFAFAHVLTGAKEMLPRYKRCIQATNNAMGEALGKVYVERYFTPSAKARALGMVKNLKAAFRERLASRAWMGDSTRAQAYAKLDSFMDKIGYPDKWLDYTTLEVTPGNSYYANREAALAFANWDDLQRVGKPVDRARWGMSPPTVNAYYDPSMNEIVFPAGILQPPFFDPNADDAVNYGGMGGVIGHEITHGFDDQGAQYDARGNLRQWFTSADLEKFKGRTGLVASQFDAYTILDSVHVNGRLTLGENIADLGGLTIAYAALQKALEGKPRAAIDGFTPEQRFFLAWAQIWRGNIRPELARMYVTTDPHSPQIWRTNGPLSNMPEFAKAWRCKAGDPMVRPDAQRADIW